jgi:hypothetical protein
MRTRAITALTAIALLTLAACSSNDSPNADTTTTAAAGKTAPAAGQPLTAADAFTKISATVKDAKLSGTVTAENDPNHLLGRPGQYTSKVTFTDSHIKASDVVDSSKGSVDLGGAVEVFADPAAATARAKYIQAVTKSLPALAEYDYVHGTVLVRVSHYLTPTQAAGYKSAANGLG